MRRRSFISGAVVGAGGLSGCIGSLGGTDPDVSPHEFPDRPDQLTPESAVEYVAAYEETRVHNYHAEAGATEVTVEAVATFDYEADDGAHVTAQHAGTVYRDRDGERDVGELYSPPVPYRVTPESTLRLDVERVRARDVDGEVSEDDGTDDDATEDDGTDDEPADPPLGVRTVNVTDHVREMTITIVSDGGDGDPVNEVDVTVGAGSAVVLVPMAIARGTYRVIARFEENGVVGEGRVDVELPGVERDANVDVVLTPDGLSTRLLPSFEYI